MSIAPPDVTLVCLGCAEPFVFTAGEQQLQQVRGIQRTPEYCAACARKAQSGLMPPSPSHGS